MTKITFRHLEIFHAVYEYGNMSRAAERLGITQPAVTRQMQQLEEKVGAPVLEIVGRRAHLTPKGKELLALGNDILHQVDDIPNQLNKSSSGEMKGQLRVGTTTIYKVPILSIMAEFNKLYPQIKFKPLFFGGEELRERLAMHELDVAISSQNLSSLTDITASKIDSFESSFIVPGDSPFAGKSISADEFFKARMLLPESSPVLASYVTQIASNAGTPLQILQLDNVYSCIMATRENLGYSIAPNFIANMPDFSYGIGQIQIKGAQTPKVTVFMSHREKDEQFAPLKALKEMLSKKNLTSYV